MSNKTIAIGDNLLYLKKLSEDNQNFDVIYIDPPYNTGNKFSYNDNRTSHAWNDFISDRLKLAKTLLKKD
jgi:adenine-specific DNA-methyltransferase